MSIPSSPESEITELVAQSLNSNHSKKTGRKPPMANSSHSNYRRHQFACRYCEKEFPRSEHMLRHERKHTGEKPFVCSQPNCGKKFSRFDNMMQHFRSHFNDQPRKKRAAKEGIFKGMISEEGVFHHILFPGVNPSAYLALQTQTPPATKWEIREEWFYQPGHERQSSNSDLEDDENEEEECEDLDSQESLNENEEQQQLFSDSPMTERKSLTPHPKSENSPNIKDCSQKTLKSETPQPIKFEISQLIKAETPNKPNPKSGDSQTIKPAENLATSTESSPLYHQITSTSTHVAFHYQTLPHHPFTPSNDSSSNLHRRLEEAQLLHHLQHLFAHHQHQHQLQFQQGQQYSPSPSVSPSSSPSLGLFTSPSPSSSALKAPFLHLPIPSSISSSSLSNFDERLIRSFRGPL